LGVFHLVGRIETHKMKRDIRPHLLADPSAQMPSEFEKHC
jgi:hypothetical protein